MSSEHNFNLAYLSFDGLVTQLGGTVVMRLLLEEAAQARTEGLDGLVVSDACGDNPPAVSVAFRSGEVEFTMGYQPHESYVLSLTEVEAQLSGLEGLAGDGYPYAA